jgi:serine/threonine-protein kinase
MAEAIRAFASYLQFKEILADPLGHLYRAGEYDASGVKRSVWLRVFDQPMLPAADLISGFERAQDISAAARSANLATGVDCVVADGQPAMVSDYIPSQPLSLVLDRVAEEQFPIQVDNALLILEKIALALASTLSVEIDGQRIVHGFLHPGLVFVTNDGEGVVSGFGIGEHLLALIDDVASADLVHPYIAPEVIVARTPSRRGDVYSLGAILFHLLTGSRLPTEADERQQALPDARIAHDDVPIPDDIGGLLRRALAERPEERFSSAADFKKELDRLLYGGAYSPTTFNLALFMDRLFRIEIEAEEEERRAEMAVDVTPFFESPAEREPEAVIESTMETAGIPKISKRLWVGIAAAAVVVVAATATIFTVTRGPRGPAPVPTPTAAEIAAQREAQEQKIRELAEGLVSEMMAVKEEEIRKELVDRQNKIDELQKRLQASERRARQGQLSSDEQRRREALQREIAAEEEAQRQREAELEAERQRAAEEAIRQAAAQQTATAAAEEEARLAVSMTPTEAPPSVEPTAVPTPQPTVAAAPESKVEKNSFVDPSDADSLPVLIKGADVMWPRSALHSRRNGVVIVQATVDADGRVVDVKVLRADHEGFGIPQAVMNAARKYRFKPGTKDGVPITTYATVTKAYRFVVR